ncbi:hypothetical protein [Microbispora triticiradicis]|uniref:hypothetical protein n=1 Tax=Microbispora triticiradicis TaxID=2200763 RepID=UPI001058FDA1|nr:hypothetical protein [Microbispora triticiradicis]GLW20682.1 hypothetical protein Mame01_07250 [Microbispora amethystogenes]
METAGILRLPEHKAADDFCVPYLAGRQSDEQTQPVLVNAHVGSLQQLTSTLFAITEVLYLAPMARGKQGFFGKYWGYAVFAAVAWGWWAADDKGKIAPLLIAGSLLAIIYFLFRVPRTCGAEGRQGPCRHNARGLLFGCNQVRQHKRQNFARKLGRDRWRELNRGLWITPKERVATLACIGSTFSGLAAIAAVILDRG